MKKFISTIIILCVITSSCEKKLDEYAINPNDPENVTLALLLGGAEVGTFANYTGDLARVTNLFTQHIAGTNFQYQDFARYDLNDQTFLNHWQSLYNGVMVNTDKLIKDSGTENPYYSGMGKVLMAMNLGLATDLWGDVPYSDAFKGLEGNTTPTYDTQESIMASIQQLLDAAIADFGQPVTANTFRPGSDDIIFNGDVAKWIRAAYILKARYHNRLSQIDPTGSATLALQALTSAGLANDPGFDMRALFFDSGTSLNQWAAFMSQRGYIRMGQFFMDKMIATADPRLPFFADVDEAGGYSGTNVSDQFNVATSTPGPGIASNASPLPLVTYPEAKFIEAEANLRLGNGAAAASAYNEAITASVSRVTGAAAPPAFVAVVAAETAATISLDKIISQKYMALFTQIEPYNDFRRTGFPVLTPNSNGITPQIPLRLPSSVEERLYNPNATVVTDIYSPVWWDK
jgi:hypothetical protein